MRYIQLSEPLVPWYMNIRFFSGKSKDIVVNANFTNKNKSNLEFKVALVWIIGWQVSLFHHHLELRSSSLTFGRTGASSVLLSLNHDLLAVLDINALRQSAIRHFATVERVDVTTLFALQRGVGSKAFNASSLFHLDNIRKLFPTICILILFFCPIRNIQGDGFWNNIPTIRCCSKRLLNKWCNGGKTWANSERPITDGRHAVRDGDGGQFTTTIKRFFAYARNTVGDGDGSKSFATMECTIADVLHAVANGDGSKTATIIVFASCFISTICALNGRKVMIWILKKMKKEKI